MNANDRFIGRVFDTRYRILSRLGTGGMAAVYLAEDQELGRRVAIKILDDRHANDVGFLERFRREAQNAASLSHPNIVAIYDRGEAEGSSYIAMEYLEGPTLKDLIVREGPLPIPVAIDYVRQILAAVGFAHRNGIVHRDIKPHNVLVGEDGRCKVTDFGIARSGASEMTEVGSIVGTAQYLSPEQARGGPISPASDLYSTGVMLYELLTGTVPFAGEQPLEIAMKHLNGVPAAPSTHRRGIPRELDSIVLRALAKTPAARYRSAEAFDAELASFARGIAPSAETEAAATALLTGGSADVGSSTAIVPPDQAAKVTKPGGAYYGYQPPGRSRRKRPRVWPWLLALLAVTAIGAGAYFGYTKIQTRLDASAPAIIPFVEGLREEQAITKIRDAELTPDVRRVAHQKVSADYVISQAPPAGEKTTKGNSVRIRVSTGLPKATVPDVRNMKESEAIAALQQALLVPQVFEIESSKPIGRVMAQDPKPGTKVAQKARVRINVSRGQKPVGVPSLAGLTFDQATQTLQDAGFTTGRTDVESNEAAGNVVGSLPGEGALLRPGQRVTLLVSKGPRAISVPDVNGLDRADALVTLKSAGLVPIVVTQDTTDPVDDGVVIGQIPIAQDEVQPGTVITITVGKLLVAPSVQVPDVSGFDEAGAVSTLEAARLRATVVPVDTTDPAQEGVVLDQQPAALESAEPGASVTITVGRLVAAPPDTTPATPPARTTAAAAARPLPKA